ncbi:peptide-methionine (S)-S-oxide reductase MsrA [Christensenellaceae bacterium OttesenSCG-928-K19]|nr:peptide-methionine (S)-S-oxide reductase MsrA [Christensenellaceae bacterium OttesenSCG-928-K19]
MKEVYLSGGCFWSMQRYFDCVHGVLQTQAGFVNGDTENPTYAEVISGKTGYAEAVRVQYNETVIPLTGILDLYFKAICPGGTERKNSLKGSQFRKGVYYTRAEDEQVILDYMEENWIIGRLCPVKLEAVKKYYPAEEYHQHYLEKNPDGHCHIGREAFIYAGEYKVPKTG